jgi:small subunit ribosomal protein S1
VASVGTDEILVDIGCKSEGVVPAKEFQTLTAEELAELRPGSSLLVQVLKPESGESSAVLSVDKARGERMWRELELAVRQGTLVSGKVVGCNRGGLLVDVQGLRGFVPHSHVLGLSGDEARREQELQAMVGQVLELKVVEVSRQGNRLVLSQKMAEEELRRSRKQRLIDQLEVGEIRRGKITGITRYGVFVDVGGADGMVHVSELSWDRIKEPSEAFTLGQELDVLVVAIDRENGRISLSIKRTQPEPWEEAVRLAPGQLVEAEITQLTDFGAFARIKSGVEGLIHISELSAKRINHPRQVVQPGDRVWVKILKVDPERRRISLSLKQAQEEVNYSSPEGAVEGEDSSIRPVAEEA